MSSWGQDGLQAKIYLGLCACLLAYVSVRLFTVPLVHDEVATYVHYVHQGEFIPGDALVDANNHIFNSALSIVFDRLFGTSRWSLRLSNLLFFFVWCYYVGRWAFSLKNFWLRWAMVLALLGSHYLTEFYSLSRGYGISFAAMLGMLWHIKQYLEKPTRHDLILVLIWAFVAVSSNLTLVFTLMIGATILALCAFKENVPKSHYAILLLLGLLIGSVVLFGIFLQNNGVLYYGQGDGFWSITMSTISRHLIGDTLVAPFILTLAALFSAIVWLKKGIGLSRLTASKWLFHVMLFGSLSGTFLSHFILGTNYPEDRVGLYLYPLLAGAFIWSIDCLTTERRSWQYASIILWALPLHFALNANTDHADFWFRERIPLSFYEHLSEAQANDSLTTLSGYHTTALSYFMGAHLKRIPVPPMLHFDFPSKQSDYVILRGAHGVELDMSGYRQIDLDEASGNTLWQRNEFRKRVQIDQWTAQTTDTISQEFFDFFRQPLTANEDYLVHFSLAYETQDIPADINLVLSSADEAGGEQHYIPYYLGWRQSDTEIKAEGTLYINGPYQGVDKSVCYLWNIDQVPLSNLDYTITLFQFE